jgi:hypothetical protein
MHLQIPSLSITEDFTNEVYYSLDLMSSMARGASLKGFEA